MRTDDDVFSGILYQGTADTTVDCIGGKITNNTITNAGGTNVNRAAIAVYHSNAAYQMIDFDVSNNKIIKPSKISFYLVNVTKSNFNNNTISDPENANARVFYLSAVTYSTISGNIARDYQGTAKIDYFLYVAGVDNNYIEVFNNGCYTTGNVAKTGKSGLYHTYGRGNKLSEVDSLRGSFILNNVSSLVVNNANIDEPTANAFYTSIIIYPLNSAAAGVMGSSQRLYISGKVSNTSFTVRTSDSSNVAAADHIFGYEIIQ